MSKKRLHHAQLEALRWLSGKAEDQLVKAFIQVHRESLERIGYPIQSNGTELVFEKRERKIKQLPGQTELAEELEKVECPLSQRVDGKLHSFKFDGDDPYVKCVYCGQVQDAITGNVITKGRR